MFAATGSTKQTQTMGENLGAHAHRLISQTMQPMSANVEKAWRSASRVKYRVDAEICAWQNNKQGPPFTVRIEDFSPTGVGLIHNSALELGSEYLIKIPRPNYSDLIILLTVVRCKQLEDGTHLVGLELSSVMDRTQMGQLVNALQTRRRVGNRRRAIASVRQGAMADISALVQESLSVSGILLGKSMGRSAALARRARASGVMPPCFSSHEAGTCALASTWRRRA